MYALHGVAVEAPGIEMRFWTKVENTSSSLPLGRSGFRVEVSKFGRVVFFFQAEDGIRDLTVTGVQTCALPIYGRAVANVSLRVPMKNYLAIMQSLDSLGKVENVSVQRQDRTDAQIDEANAPADVSIQVYSQGNIVTEESGLLATLRRTLAQSAGAIMWSLRMIGVAIAFLAPWAIAIVGVIWVGRRIIRAKR